MPMPNHMRDIDHHRPSFISHVQGVTDRMAGPASGRQEGRYSIVVSSINIRKKNMNSKNDRPSAASTRRPLRRQPLNCRGGAKLQQCKADNQKAKSAEERRRQRRRGRSGNVRRILMKRRNSYPARCEAQQQLHVEHGKRRYVTKNTENSGICEHGREE
jgi:hypothetical protein